MISTPFLPVPPLRYGGTELVVFDLVEGLRQAGHDVTLFTVGESRARGALRSLYRRAVWPPDPYHEQNHAAWAIAELIGSDRACDIVHAHVPAVLPLGRFAPAPIVYTLHHARAEALTEFYAMQHGIEFVAISERQRALLPELARVSVVHHGLDPRRYDLGPGGEKALFLGRIAREKGAHTAIDVARRARAELLVAGEAHWKDRDYFAAEIAPRLRGRTDVRRLGEIDHDEKVPLLGAVRALLFPIAWEEPFGLVMIEAMFAGTPVLAFPRGSVAEIVEDGITGWICHDETEMAARLFDLGRHRFDRRRCRARAVERFGRARMIGDYLRIYERVAERARAGEARVGEAVGE